MSATCPTPGRSLGARLRRAAGVSRPLAALVASTALFGIAPSVASAANADEVQLTGVFAAPISNTEQRCTPEPNDRFVYSTDGPVTGTGTAMSVGYGDAIAYPGAVNYQPGNRLSSGDITFQRQAGAVNDLCFGFTLSPNVEPAVVKSASSGNSGQRFQDSPALAVVPGTAVWTDRLDHDDLKSATITMPAGFAGSPDWAEQCTDEQFGLDNFKTVTCAPETLAGTVFARITAALKNSDGNGARSHLVAGGFADTTGVPLNDGGYVYNLTHGPNELARLGVAIQPVSGIAPAKFTVSLRLTSDGRVQTTVNDAPYYAYDLYDVVDLEDAGVTEDDPAYGTLLPGAVRSPIYLESFAIRAFGSKQGRDMQQDFVEWGTDCTNPIKARAEVETRLGAKSALDSNSFTMTGCDTLPFMPTLEVKASEKKPGVPTGVEVKLALGQTNSGPKSALLKNAEVTLPAGLEIGAQVASGDAGLKLCSAAQFAKDSSAANSCPAGSEQGDVTIVTPLLNRNFVGKVYLGEQAAVGELPPLYLEAAAAGSSGPDAPRIKLEGTVKVDDNGTLTTTFADAPQLRFSELRLNFPNGDNALFTTPRKCGVAEGVSQLTSWAKPDVKVPVTSSIDINEDCATPGFAPSFAFESANNAVGNSSPTKITIAREDRSPWLTTTKVSLPAGFLADLKLATECSKADAAAGNCPASSRMGSVTTVAGVGPKPLSLGGDIFLVERSEGAVVDVAIVVDAKIGDLQLGKVIVPGSINLRPSDAGLTMATTAPTRFKGIALNLRSIVVNLDRENFPLNPTACGPLTATAELGGDGGETVRIDQPVSFAGCAGLPFQPGFSAKLSGAGELKPKGHPQVDVTMTPRAGDSNLRSAKVVLPKGISTDINNLKNVCPRDVFEAGACAPETQVGNVSATVSITNDVIAGTVHLVRVEGTALPGIGMNFTGRYAVRVLSTVKLDKDLRVITEFGNIPDLPLRRLDMTIAGGAKSPIQISPAACTANTAWEASLGGQGGQSSQVNVPVTCKDLGNEPETAPTQKASWTAKGGLKYTLTAATGTKLGSAKITLPKGFKIKTRKKDQKKYLKVTVSAKGTGKVKVSKTSIAITGKGAGPSKITITLKPKGYTAPKKVLKKGKLKKKTKLTFKSRVVVKNSAKAIAKSIKVTTK